MPKPPASEPDAEPDGGARAAPGPSSDTSQACWTCPACRSAVPVASALCSGCGRKQPEYPFWACPNCGIGNWMERTQCRRCEAPPPWLLASYLAAQWICLHCGGSNVGSAFPPPRLGSALGMAPITSDPLPTPWTQHFCKEQRKPYFHNSESNEVTWERPLSPAQRASSPPVARPGGGRAKEKGRQVTDMNACFSVGMLLRM